MQEVIAIRGFCERVLQEIEGFEEMLIKELEIKDLRPAEYNPRQSTQKQESDLKKSLEKFGCVEPIIVNMNKDRKYIIIGGHFRVRELKKLGIKKVYCVCLDLNLEDEKELNIRLNKNTGSFDSDLLANNFDEMDLMDWGFDEIELGMDVAEQEAKEDDYEMPDEIQTDIVKGDLFDIYKNGELRHKLLCGDSTILDDVKKLMEDEKADMVFTDPPYGVSYVGLNNPNGRKWDMIKNDELRGDGLFLFLFEAFNRIYEFTKDSVAVYVFHASSTQIQFETALNKSGFLVKQQLIWNKGMILGHSDYHWAHEPVFYCKKKEQKTQWFGDRTQKTILGMRRTELITMKKEDLIQIIKNLLDGSSNWEIDREKVINYQHPTQKPVFLAGRSIINSSKNNDLVLDIFLGSGTTMVASHQLNRRCFGMELDEKYCAVILQRMIKLDKDLIIKRNGIDETEEHRSE